MTSAAPAPIFVLLYTSADDVAAKARAHFPAHKARQFATGDPFVLNGVVRAWEVRQWNETYRDRP